MQYAEIAQVVSLFIGISVDFSPLLVRRSVGISAWRKKTQLVNFETAGNYAPKLEINAHIFAMTRRRDVSKQLSL